MQNLFLLFSVILPLLLAPAAHANLVSNGSFEMFTGTFAGDGCHQSTSGDTTLTGWVPTGSEIAVCTTPNQYLIIASDGSNFLDIAGYQNTLNKGVTQTLGGLTIGQQYAFSADLGVSNIADCVPGSTCAGPISVLVTIGDVSQTLTHNSADAGVQWASYGFTFTADSVGPTLTVVGADLPAGGAFIGLDNLTLVTVPEPASVTLVALGAAGILRRRRIC